MPTAKKLPSGSWRTQVSKVINGQLVKKSFTASDKHVAERQAIEWQLKAEQDNDADITLKQAYERYIAAKRNVLSPSTIRGYERLSKYSLQDIMKFKIDRLTTEQIQRSVNIYAADHSAKSVRNCSGLLSAVLKMFRPGFNLNITLPQKEKKDIYIPTDKDIKRLLQITKGSDYYVPILLAAIGGMRQGEICAVTSDDINGTFVHVNKSLVLTPEGELKVKAPKTYSSNRLVEFPQFVIDELNKIDGKLVKLTPRALSVGFGRLLKKNGFDHFRFHDLRHYYVSTLHSIGIPDKYIMAQGGWSTNHTMQTVYNHALADKKTEFSEQISNHFATVNKA